jgi:hypothetical protein
VGCLRRRREQEWKPPILALATPTVLDLTSLNSSDGASLDSMLRLLDLPDEILIGILGYLPAKGILAFGAVGGMKNILFARH